VKPVIAIATCAELPVADDDGVLLADSLATVGIESVPVIWDAPERPWSDFDLVVLRSTWDYTEKLPAFLDFVEHLARVENSAEVVRWNTDKHYLDDLARRAIPTIPTTYAHRGDDLVLPEGSVVVKPTVGAGSMGAEQFGPDQHAEAAAHVERLVVQGKVAMVQPYLDLVEDLGETAVVLIDGIPAHAIRKGPLLTVSELDRTGLYRTESIEAREASAEERAVATAAHGAACAHLGRTSPLLYCRVDLLPGPHGPVVVELEATEPSLFLSFSPPTADLLAEAILSRLAPTA